MPAPLSSPGRAARLSLPPVDCNFEMNPRRGAPRRAWAAPKRPKAARWAVPVGDNGPVRERWCSPQGRPDSHSSAIDSNDNRIFRRSKTLQRTAFQRPSAPEHVNGTRFSNAGRARASSVKKSIAARKTAQCAAFGSKIAAYLLVFIKVLARAASGELGNFLISSCMRALAAAPWFSLLKLMPCLRYAPGARVDLGNFLITAS